jgi:hypothetical protein
MAHRPTSAIAGSDRLVNVDGFERAHVRPRNTRRTPRTPDDRLTR